MIQDLSSLPVPVVEAVLLPVVEAVLLPVVEAVLLPVVQVLIMYRKEWEMWVTLTARCSHSTTTNSVTFAVMQSCVAICTAL